ncbi:MAG: hypothetical protein JSW61_00420 [Candidatus Thorarchaeota archaeon]|nr:MAG: hypothetical protein JSW61_00420 [Candidatus Thorarchaeota archaeon]
MAKGTTGLVDRLWKMGEFSKQRVRFLSDHVVLQPATISSHWGQSDSKLMPSHFEKRFGLRPVVVEPVSKRIESSLFGGRIVEQETRDHLASADSLLEQVDFVIPDEDSIDPLLRPHRESLSYVFSRIVMGRFPEDSSWLWYTPGLDRFSNALFALQWFSRLSGVHLPWHDAVNDHSQGLSHQSKEAVVSMRPDGIPASEWEPFLSKLRREISILCYRPLVAICEKLGDVSSPKRMTWRDVVDVMGLKKRTAGIALNNIELTLTERFVIGVSRLGLRYRYVLSPRERDPPSISVSRGLCEVVSFSKAVGRRPRHMSLYGHVEPDSSLGPQNLHSGMQELAVDEETVSMRMDFFNSDRKEQWELPVDDHTTVTPGRNPSWIIRKSDPPSKRPFKPTLRQAEVLAALWSHRGSARSLEILMNVLSIPRSTAKVSVDTLLKNRIVSTLYHPAIELSALPELIVVGVIESNQRRTNEFVKLLLARFPFVELKRGSSTGAFIAHIRVPANRGVFFVSFLESELEAISLPEESVFVGLVDRRMTHLIALPFRLYSPRIREWHDPWDVIG